MTRSLSHPQHPHNPPRPGGDTLASDGGEKKARKVHKIKIQKHKIKQTNDVSNTEIQLQHAQGPVVYQVVIDRVGHGVAPDPPILLPEAVTASVEFQETDVQATATREWEWQHRDSITLAVVGAVVLLVAAVVIAFARRQQRAYERRLAQEQQQHEATDPTDPTAGTVDLNALRFDMTGIRTTRDDDEVGTPESVSEGVV